MSTKDLQMEGIREGKCPLQSHGEVDTMTISFTKSGNNSGIGFKVQTRIGTVTSDEFLSNTSPSYMLGLRIHY